MNKRIQELATQAEMSANKGDHVDVKQMMEKFAELIVQDCANFINGSDDEYTGEFDTKLAFELKCHFGINE